MSGWTSRRDLPGLENEADGDTTPMLTNDAARPVRDPQPESSIDAALGDAFTSQGRSNRTLASGPEGGSQGATPSSPRVNPL